MIKLNGVKNVIMHMTYFLNGSMFNSFYCHIILYWEKVTSYEKFSHSLTIEVQILLRLWEIVFLRGYTEIRDICIQNASRIQFLGVCKWCSVNVFSDTKQKYVCWKIYKVRKVYGCVAGAYYFQCQVSWGP